MKFNVILGCWDFGTLSRTAWTDQSVVGNPIGAYGSTAQLYEHEVGQNDDGNPMDSYFQTGAFPISDGQKLNFVDWFFPDFHWENMAVRAIRSWTSHSRSGITNSVTKESDPTRSAGHQIRHTRLRARYAAMRVENSTLDAFWRLGGLTIRSAPDGTLS